MKRLVIERRNALSVLEFWYTFLDIVSQLILLGNCIFFWFCSASAWYSQLVSLVTMHSFYDFEIFLKVHDIKTMKGCEVLRLILDYWECNLSDHLKEFLNI